MDVDRLARLNHDEATVVQMLAALRQCNPSQQLDTLAVVIKVFVEKWPEVVRS